MKIDALCEWYANLAPETLEGLRDLYRDNARFRDPFNDVLGHDAIINIFDHMFKKTRNPKFQITEVQQSDPLAWVSWTFTFCISNKVFSIEGATRLEFAEDGRVIYHRDYWDAAELYEQLPIIGRIIRVLREKMRPTENHRQ